MATRDITCGDCQSVFTVERGAGASAGRWPNYCPPCRVERDRASNRRKQYRWRATNPEKWQAVQARANEKRLADPDHRREKREAAIFRTYGITAEEMAERLASQGGVCAICQKPPGGRANGQAREGHAPALHVDHCHTTGRIRGLLCSNCNTMIGLANEDPAVLLAAIEYLGGAVGGVNELGEDSGGLLKAIEPA